MPKGYVRLVCDSCEGKLTRTPDGGLECKHCGIEYERERDPDTNLEFIRFNVASPFSLSACAFPGITVDRDWNGEGVAPAIAY